MICCSLRTAGRSCSPRSADWPNTSTTATRWAFRCSIRGRTGWRRSTTGSAAAPSGSPRPGADPAREPRAPDPRRDRRPPGVGLTRAPSATATRCRRGCDGTTRSRSCSRCSRSATSSSTTPASSTGACDSTSPCTRAAPTPFPWRSASTHTSPAGRAARAWQRRAAGDAPARARRRSDPDRPRQAFPARRFELGEQEFDDAFDQVAEPGPLRRGGRRSPRRGRVPPRLPVRAGVRPAQRRVHLLRADGCAPAALAVWVTAEKRV